jgi:hypothetical protein
MFSGAVNIIDPNNDYKKEILTNTSEWEGPSFSKVFEVKKSNNSNNDFLATVNYAGKIEIRQIFVNKAGITTEIIENLIDDIEIGGKSEGFDVVSQNGKFALLATNTLNSDYTPASSVSLISGLIPDDVNESMDNDLLLLPNPSKGILKLHNIELDENNQFVIYNTQGQIVLKKNLSNHLIDISFLENGVYFVCFSQSNKLFYQKIILIK